MTSTAVERVDEDGCIGLGHKLQRMTWNGKPVVTICVRVFRYFIFGSHKERARRVIRIIGRTPDQYDEVGLK